MADAIAAIINFFVWLAGLLGFGKPDPVAQGEQLGKAEMISTNTLGELSDVKKASDARAAVSDDPSDIVYDPANTGPDTASQRR